MATIFGAAAAGSAASAGTAAAASGAAAAGAGSALTVAGTNAALAGISSGAAAGSLISAATIANVATGLSVLSMVRQGQAAKVNADIQADRLRRDATIREVERRKRLVSSLASQNATRAASGIAFGSGSSKNIALEDIRQGAGSMISDRAYSESAAQSIESAGSYRRGTSYINAGASLLNQFDRNLTRG